MYIGKVDYKNEPTFTHADSDMGFMPSINESGASKAKTTIVT